MDCEWVELLLMDYRDGACIDPLREKIDRHLAACAACRAECGALAAVDAGLAGVRLPDPPAEITDGVMRAALRPVAPVPRWRDIRSLAAAAAILAATLGTYYLFQEKVQPYMPDMRVVTEVAGAASRTGGSIVGSVIDFARDRLTLEDGGARP